LRRYGIGVKKGIPPLISKEERARLLDARRLDSEIWTL
jgi:hypothetical protein